MMAVLAVAAMCAAAEGTRPTVYNQPTFKITNLTNVVYGSGLQCNDAQRTPSGCHAMDLVLDVTSPVGTPTLPRPAIIMVHGGGWIGGTANDAWAQASSVFYASRGFATFRIVYRVQHDNGSFPANWPVIKPGSPAVPDQIRALAYPATRDLKAAIRFVRANAKRFGVDPGRIALSGGSAGAIDSVGAGVVDEGDYKDELLATDPTLNTTHLNTSSAVQCIVSHWGAGYVAELVQAADPSKRSRYSATSAPIIEFHGNKDTSVPFADAVAVQTAYKKENSSGNLVYDLQVLDGCGHTSWCAGCGNADKHCKCAVQGTFCHAMDITALPFVAKHLDLDLQGPPPPPPSPPGPPPSPGPSPGPSPHPPSPPSPPGPDDKCSAALEFWCSKSLYPTSNKCAACAKGHELALAAAGCKKNQVKQLCKSRKMDDYLDGKDDLLVELIDGGDLEAGGYKK